MSNRFTTLLFVLLCSILLFPCTASAYSTKELVDKCSPSVVQVLMFDQQGQQLGLGSGFVIGPELVATCYHVIAHGIKAQVKTPEEFSYPVVGVVAADKKKDLAILRVKRLTELTPLPLGNAKAVMPGEKVTVIGSPLGLEGSVTDGVVSQLRLFPPFGDVIQVSCPVSPGNSGGPLLNEKGQVIGVVSFSLVDGQNINFGIATSTLQDMMAHPFETDKTLVELIKSEEDEGTAASRKVYGMLEPQKAAIKITVPSKAPYTVAPFIGINYVEGTLKVALYDKKKKAGIEVPLVAKESELTIPSYRMLPNSVLSFSKALAGKEVYVAFLYQPLRIAYAIPNADNVDRTAVAEVINKKLKSLGYEVVQGAEVDAAVASINTDDPNYGHLLAKQLSCARFLVVNVATQTRDCEYDSYFQGFTKTEYTTSMAVSLVDLNQDKIILTKEVTRQGQVGKLRSGDRRNKELMMDCLDSILGEKTIILIEE